MDEPEPENFGDENGWGLLSDILEDIREQCFEGSAVILIIATLLFAVYAPSVFRLLTAWVTRGKG